MRRVHRNLSRAEIESLRLRLTELVPVRGGSIRQVVRMMRLITRKSQSEYARMCAVAPRVLAAVEAGTGSPTVETLEKLLRPFGFRVGVVRVAEGWDATDEETSELEETPRAKTVESALTRALRKSRSKANERAHEKGDGQFAQGAGMLLRYGFEVSANTSLASGSA